MYKGFKSFEEVKAWQVARAFKNKIYTVSEKFPSQK